MQDFRRLAVWNKGHVLTLKLYGVTAAFPREEVYGLTSQVRRAASSIPANIGEGCGRGSDADLARFLQMSLGSASELDYHLQLAHELSYLKDEEYGGLATDSAEITHAGWIPQTNPQSAAEY